MSETPPPVDQLPQPGYPDVQWIKEHYYARWVFATADQAVQLREFLHWCGWFGYNENDRPVRVEGNSWWIYSSLNSPPGLSVPPAAAERGLCRAPEMKSPGLHGRGPGLHSC